MSQQIKSISLVVAMVAGVALHSILGRLSFIAPYLIFAMLLITYCRISLRDLHFSPMHIVMLAFQTLISLAAYFALAPFDLILAEGVMICIFIPTANASPVIAGMLGGDVAVLATYLLFCNVAAAILAPIYFGFMGATGVEIAGAVGDTVVASGSGGVGVVGGAQLTFWVAVSYIFKRVVPLILGPFILSLLLEHFVKPLHAIIRDAQSVTFYLWNVTLMLVVAGATSLIIDEYRSGAFGMGRFLEYIFVALLVCALQFIIGRRLGRRFGDPVVGGQGLGQKNTVLAVWMTTMLLNPIAAIFPAAYIFWQNLVNSVQIWRHIGRKL